MVLGVRVHGDNVVDAEVALDDVFAEVPVPTRMGVPLLCKRLSGTGGDDSAIRRSAVVRIMADPDDGFAPMEWQYGGARGPAPPVIFARRDGVPFSTHDWRCMDRYIGEWLDEAGDADEERAAVNARFLAPDALAAFARSQEDFPAAFLSLRFPVGCVVVADGLSTTELNGREAEVMRFGRDRVGVCFSELPGRGVVAVRPERLTLVRSAPAPEEPEAKRANIGTSNDERKREVARQDAVAIARRFVDCMHKDEFPERGDLHLFGLGTDYQVRATEVLAVWQGAVKCGDVTEESLAEALSTEQVKEYFKTTCHKFAASKNPNSTYAKALVEAKFATVEWDDL